MASDSIKPFLSIAERVSKECASIPCSREVYVEGLRAIIETLDADVEAILWDEYEEYDDDEEGV